MAKSYCSAQSADWCLSKIIDEAFLKLYMLTFFNSKECTHILRNNVHLVQSQESTHMQVVCHIHISPQKAFKRPQNKFSIFPPWSLPFVVVIKHYAVAGVNSWWLHNSSMCKMYMFPWLHRSSMPAEYCCQNHAAISFHAFFESFVPVLTGAL